MAPHRKRLGRPGGGRESAALRPSSSSCILLVVTLLLAGVPLSLVGGSASDRAAFQINVTTFAGGNPTLGIVIEELPKEVVDDGFALQDGLTIDDASMVATGSGHPVNGSFLRDVELDIGNDGDIDWAFEGIGYGALGMQDRFTNGMLDANGTVVIGTLTNTSYGIWLPKNATVTATSATVTVMAVNVAVECPVGGASCDEALEVVTMLQNDGFGATVVNPTDIDTVGELAGYTTVIVGGSGSQENHLDLFAPALRTYVEGGGGVIFAGFISDDSQCCFSGSADINAIMPVDPWACWSCTGSGTIQIVGPADPVTAGINSFDLNIYFPTNTLINGGTQLGDSSNDPGEITIASTTIISGRSVYLGMPYVYDNDDAGGWGSDPGIYNDVDAQNLLRNAVTWTSGSISMDASIDIGNDGDDQWSATAFSGNESMAGFTAELNGLIAATPTTMTDNFGNEMVRIPLALQGSSTGLVGMGKMRVEYDYEAYIRQKPAGDLETELDAALSASPSTVQVSFPLGLESSTAGLLTLSQLNVLGTPPPHAPRFDEVAPDNDAFSMPENTSQPFTALPGDDYGNPITMRWRLDGAEVANGDNYTYSPDFDDSGAHLVEVIADNGLQTLIHPWEVTVTNVNRGPIILGSAPALDAAVLEASMTTFTINATDPDGDPLTYKWFEDGIARTTEFLGSFSVTYTYKSAGVHHIKVQVVDPDNDMVERQWDITVTDVNALTKVISSRPSDGVAVAELGELGFAVTATSPDGDPLSYRWELDGTALASQTTSTTSYAPTYDDAGHHTMVVVIGDGREPVEVWWNFTVIDVNREPVAAITSPLPDVKVFRGQKLHLQATDQPDLDGDTLTYTWTLDNKEIATGVEADYIVAANDGGHSLTLEVSDGRGGLATADLDISVTSLKFTGRLFLKGEDLVADREIKMRVELTNVGTASATEVPVRVLLDGIEVTTTTMATTKPAQVHNVPFTIKVGAGTHTLTIEVQGSVVVTKQLEISATPPSPLVLGPGGEGGLPLVLLLVVALAIGGSIFAVVVMRKRRSAAAQQQAATQPMTPSHAPYGSGGAVGLPPLPPFQGTLNAPGAPIQATVISTSYGTATPGAAIPPTAGYGTTPPGAYGSAATATGPMASGDRPSPNALLTATPTTPDQVSAYLNEVEGLIVQKAAGGTDVQRANAQMTLARTHMRAGRYAQAHQAAKQAYVRLR